MLLETWLQIETSFAKGNEEADAVKEVREKLPIKVRKRRAIPAENRDTGDATHAGDQATEEIEVIPEGEDAQMADQGWEEFYDYMFPEDERTG